MSTAYLWHGYGRATIGTRSDIEQVPIERLQAFYQQVLPARQRDAGGRRKVRRRQDAGAGSRTPSAPFRSPPASSSATYTRRTHPGRRARSDSAPDRRYSGHHDGVSTPPPARIPMPPRSKSWPRCSAKRPPAASTRRWSKPRKPSPPSGDNIDFHDPGMLEFSATSAKGRVARRRRKDHARGHRRRREGAALKRKSMRADPPAQKYRACSSTTPQQVACR